MVVLPRPRRRDAVASLPTDGTSKSQKLPSRRKEVVLADKEVPEGVMTAIDVHINTGHV
jgi:hypothetical protein